MPSTTQLYYVSLGLRRDGTFEKRIISDRIILQEADPNMYDAIDAIRFAMGHRIPLVLLVSPLPGTLHCSDFVQIPPQGIDVDDRFTLCERLNALGPVDFQGQVWRRWRESSTASGVWPNGPPHISKVALVAVKEEEFELLSTYSSIAI